MRILFVDDDHSNGAAVGSLLAEYGHEVLRADSLELAAELMKESGAPDFVVFGMKRLPAELAKLLHVSASEDRRRRIQATQELPVLSDDQVTTVGPEAEKMRDFRNMFLVVQTKYVMGLTAKLADLRLAIDQARTTGGELEAVKRARMHAHKMNGTAGSLGYRQISEPMKVIETTYDAMMADELDEPGQKERAWAEIELQFDLAKQAGVVLLKELEKLPGPDGKSSVYYKAPMAKVLVVDEDERFLDVVEHLGRQRMVEVVRATSVAEALERACLVSLDAALLNVPERKADESFKLARELRGLPGYESLPLAFISASSHLQDRVEAVHAGASLYLDKPLESQALESAVQYLVAIRQGGRPRVLIIDDDPDFCELLSVTLRNEGLLIRTVNDPARVLDVMQEFPPELMLLDVNMPNISGFDVCKMVRGIPRWQDLPIIFLTAQTGVQARVSAFQAGADDYLPKPVINEELLARVKVRLDRSRLMKERSDKDTITGLLLRRAFAEQLNAMLADAQRNQLIFTICLLDVDHFKHVNDTYGHLAGDQVLTMLGQLLMRRFRVDDLRGRWGGEEFILAFRRESKQTMQRAVARFLDEFKQLSFQSDSGQEFRCSFSGGLASYPADGQSIFDLIKAADERLYYAKESGRSRVVADL
jgi:diguanylate cyclase (GGDEF)-like protein